MANRKISISALSSKAEKALQQAVRQVIKDHKQTGQPVVIWHAGKVIRIPAARLLRKLL